MSFRPGSPMPRSNNINSVLFARAKFEATIQQNSLRNDGRSKTFLTNVAANNSYSSSSLSLPRAAPPRIRRARRQSSLTSVDDIEAEFHKIMGDDADAMSIQSLPATLDYKYATGNSNDFGNDDNASIAESSTIVSYNEVGDYMYFDAMPAKEATWKEQLMPAGSHTTRPPAMIQAGRSSPVTLTTIVSPLSSPRSTMSGSNMSSDAFRRKKRVFETQKHANKLVKVDLAPLLVKAAFLTGGGHDDNRDGCCCGNSVGSDKSGASSVSSLGDVLVDIYAQSMMQHHHSNRRGSDTTSTERSDSPTDHDDDYDPSTSTTAAVFTIIEEDEDLSSSDSEAPVVKEAVTKRPVIDPRASPSFFLNRFKRAASFKGNGLGGQQQQQQQDMPTTSRSQCSNSSQAIIEPRKKSLTKRGLTRSARMANRRQDGDGLY